MALNKHYISPSQLLQDAFQLGWQVYTSGFRPDFILAVWRGGTPVGVAVHELLDLLGIKSDHLAIRTTSYTGIGQRDDTVRVDCWSKPQHVIYFSGPQARARACRFR